MTLNQFFSLFLLSSIIIYFGLSPYVIDQKKIQDIPQLEFESFTSYEIEGENVNFVLNGQNARRYANKFLLKDFVLHREANNSLSSIAAIEGVFQNKKIILKNMVQYQGRDGLLLETQSATYDTKQETLDIDTPFRLTQDSSVITGNSLFFNQNNDKISAKDVKASMDIQ